MNTLTSEVAQRIVDRTMTVIGRNVNVMDDRGLILATGDAVRLGTRHEGALVAAQHDRLVVVDAGQAGVLQGVQPGVNVPLHHRGEVVGVVGISGDPHEVQVYADLIRVAAELILEQAGVLETGQQLQQEREDYLAAVVSGRLVWPAAAGRGIELGIAAEILRGCTLVRSRAGGGTLALRTLQRRLVRTPDVLVCRTGAEDVAIWWRADVAAPRDEVRRVVASSAEELVCADGAAFAGQDGLRRSWLTAHDALAVAHLAAGLYEQRDLRLVALLCGLRQDWRAEPVSAPWRALVAADAHGELRATLRAWMENDLHAGRCAAALHVHRNTLRGRLERIERVTGLELRRVPSLLQLYVGPLLAPDERPDTGEGSGGVPTYWDA